MTTQPSLTAPAEGETTLSPQNTRPTALRVAMHRAIACKRTAPAAAFCALGLIAVAAPLQAATPVFVEHVVSNNADGAYSVSSADVDGDGDIDLLSASWRDDKIAWYENDGNQNFTEHVVSTNVNEPLSVASADVDGDGDIDLLSASLEDDKIAWYENDGADNFTQHVVSTNADGAFSIASADVDGDGDIDLLAASRDGGEIAWYENDGNENFTEHVVSTNADEAYSVSSADVDGDGDIDLLSASGDEDKIAWYENDGNQNFTEHVVSTNANGAFSVASADVDGDGDIDLFSAAEIDDKIAWYENDGNGNFTEHVVSTNADGANSVASADVDGDGDIDLFSASSRDDKIAWYENDGAGNFTEHVVSTNADGAFSVASADVDGDGDIDLLSASSFDDKIAWYENLQPNQSPSFQVGPDITVCKNAGDQAIRGWAKNVTDGNPEEQSLTFTVENDNPDLFGGLLNLGGEPDVGADGTLYFRPALNAFGGATMTISLMDGGEHTTGGPLGTGQQTFTIYVDPACDDGAGEIFNPGQFDFDFLRVLDTIGNIPLGGIDGTGNLYQATITNNGAAVNNLMLNLKLSGHGEVLKADSRCEGDAVSGAYRCQLGSLSSGDTSLEFSVRNSGNVTAEAELLPAEERAASDSPAQSGGGSLGWLSLLGLAALRRRK